MQEKLEVMAGRISVGEVVALGFVAVALLLGLAAWAYGATQNFASCDPPQHLINIKPGHVYVCPPKYTHMWTVHTLCTGFWPGLLRQRSSRLRSH
jgi:hypothetical protein